MYLEQPILSYYVIYFETFRTIIQQTEKEALRCSGIMTEHPLSKDSDCHTMAVTIASHNADGQTDSLKLCIRRHGAKSISLPDL